MAALNLLHGGKNSLIKVFGSSVPHLSVGMAGGVLNVHPTNTNGNLWQFAALSNQYLCFPNGHAVKLLAAPHSNLRYLPWQPDHCTGMELDGAASVFVTGPINGCSFMMARAASGRAVVLHANSNQHTGDIRGRNNAQLQYAVNYLTHYHGGAGVQFETQYERDMGGNQGWIIGSDVHGDGRTWNILLVHDEKLGRFKSYVKSLGTATI